MHRNCYHFNTFNLLSLSLDFTNKVFYTFALEAEQKTAERFTYCVCEFFYVSCDYFRSAKSTKRSDNISKQLFTLVCLDFVVRKYQII